MVTNKLSLTYLTEHLGIDNFNLLKKSYGSIVEDGYFEEDISDKQLASLMFNNAISDDFFYKSQRLIEFCYALPAISQEKIKSKLKLDSLEDLKWNKITSDYFIDELKLDPKFSFKDKVNSLSNLGIEIFEAPILSFKKLKEYQSNLYFNAASYIKKTAYARCIIQMPTGSGKTRTAMEIICDVINETGKDVLWLANTEELCDQAFDSFNEIWYFLRKRSAKSVNHLRANKMTNIENEIPTFHISTLQSFNSENIFDKVAEMGLNLQNLELVLVDEAHISIAPTYRKTISTFIEKGAKLVGLTATPGRQLNSSQTNRENESLGDFYFNKKFEIDTGDILPIEYLRNEGILSNASFVSIEGAILESTLNSIELKNMNINKVIPKKIEMLLTSDSKRNAIIFDQLVKLLEQDKKILFFATSVVHSKLISTLLNFKGYPAAHIDGNSGKYRRDIIKRFKNGEIKIICNYGVLSTGFDDPKVDVVFMTRPTNSIVLYSQIIGRGLRGPIIGGTEVCEIYTVVDNIIDLPNNNEIYSYFDDYFINN